MHKKHIFTTISALAIVAYFTTVYVIYAFDRKLHKDAEIRINFNQIDPLSKSAFDVLNKNGCQYCHTPNSALPFYANFPIAKQMMQKDIHNGLREFDMTDLIKNIEKNAVISEVDLAKLKSVLIQNSMPPANFLLMHWNSHLSTDEKQILLHWIKQEHKKRYPNSDVLDEFQDDAVQPISTVFPTDSRKVNLGEKLYHDTRLSGDNTLSCATCHDLKTGGVDRRDVSVGIHGQKGHINAPTVYNAVFNIKQFWDGRAADLIEQADGPPLNPIEMGSVSWDQIIAKLKTDPQLVSQFNQIYPDGMTAQNIKESIAEFEKTLTTPNSRFDQYLKGDKNALTAQEIDGYKLFKQYQCQTCHVGQSMGGQSFEVMGLKAHYFFDRGHLTEEDNGRYNVTHNPLDMNRFKVPNLRNVELTPPYFHDAHAKTLEDAVRDMGKYQVGVNLTQEEVDKITAFLKTLNGVQMSF